jgi:DNA-3-methyladenine glycosylase II
MAGIGPGAGADTGPAGASAVVAVALIVRMLRVVSAILVSAASVVPVASSVAAVATQRIRSAAGYGEAMAIAPSPAALDRAGLVAAVAELASRDSDLAAIVDRLGPPPLWARQPGFATLVAIVLEQQVSLRSGAAALARLGAAAGSVEPAAIAGLGEAGARAAGLTRQKSRFVVGIATTILAGTMDLDAVANADDDEARAMLTTLVGVGPWTADIYLLMALGRPDIWPVGDLALAAALRRAKGLERPPGADEQRTIAAAWQPWRAVAARLLWHAYLAGER